MPSEVDKIRESLLKKRKPPEPEGGPDWSKGLSTGSTLLNLACSGRPDVGYLPGHYFFLVGDSSAGKTWLALTAFAEAAHNPAFKKHRLIFDNAENGALMSVERFFGKATASRLEPPAGTRKAPRYSGTVESFYFHLDDWLSKGDPFLYVLDSMDALTTEDEGKFFRKQKGRKKGGDEDGKGTYGTSKAKINSGNLRVVWNKMRQSDSILIILSQTRDNIGYGAQFQPKTRAGGHALTFYAALELWLSVGGHLKGSFKGKPVEQGIVSKIRVRKNRLQGKDRTVLVPILHSHGIDDVGGMIDFLVQWKHWKGSKDGDTAGESGIIKAPELGLEGGRETLARKVEEAGKAGELRELIARVWDEVEDAVAVKRQSRYA